MKQTLALLLLTLYPILAAAPEGFHIWHPDELKGYAKKLAPKMDANKVATQNLSNYGNHFTMVAHREANGQAEVHTHVADLFVVQSGEGKLVVGGTMVNPKTTQPGEIRAGSIKDGTEVPVAAGDVVHIPANTPHQLLIAAGKEITYFVMKVDTK